MTELPIVTRLMAYQPVSYVNGSFWPTLGTPCTEAADLITELVGAVRGLRANDGSNGIYHAGKCYDFGKQVDALLAKATTHER